MEMPVYNISYSTVNGPGKRMVIWVQGCGLNCNGCFNSHAHSYTRDKCIDIENLANKINTDTSIEGITVSGGEPLDFTNELGLLLNRVKPVLTKIIFSGYTVDEIVNDKGKMKVVKQADLIIAGRYDKKLKHPYLGKKIIDVTGRIEANSFLPKIEIEYSLTNNQVIKSGIF